MKLGSTTITKSYYPILLILFLFQIISCKNKEETMKKVDLEFHGKYAGGWSSTASNGSIYNGIAASAIISPGFNDIYSGEFFFTRNHVPCCNGVGNNGTIFFTMKGSVITDFKSYWKSSCLNMIQYFITYKTWGSTVKLNYNLF